MASGNDGFGPRWLAEHSLDLVSGRTAATLRSTALARGAGGSKNPVGCQVTDGRALTHVRIRLPGESSQGLFAEPGLRRRRRELALS